jgi:hypothetical protein
LLLFSAENEDHIRSASAIEIRLAKLNMLPRYRDLQ